MTYRIDTVGKLDGSKRTPQGGLKVNAYPTRIGVLTYRQPDGSVIRELRMPEEVFNSDSLESLHGAPVTIGHPGKVTTDVWKQHAVGHVGDDVAAKETFVSATLRIQDSKAVKAVESGELLELSCGYNCDMDVTPGEFNGEKYDQIQRNIRYDHVALLPVNHGRAGNDVRIRFDGHTEMPEAPCKLSTMSLELVTAERDQARKDAADLKTANDRLAGERDALAVQVKELSDPARMDALVAKTVALHTDARVILPEADFKGKDALAIMVECLAKSDSSFKTDGRSFDYVESRFDAAVAATKAGLAGLASARTTMDAAQVVQEKDPIAEAKARNDAASANAWKVKK